MKTEDAILELRNKLNLSQDEFAKRLLVTRQAVSRWENGNTIPSTDTLKFIANTFDVSVDYLFGNPAGQCQSCGMNLEQDCDKGTTSDGEKSEAYCAFCYQEGKFAHDVTMEEMVAYNLQTLDEWNRATGLNLTVDEAREQLMEFLPTLERWKKQTAIDN